MAQVDYPYSADFLGLLPPWPVNVSCNLMIDEYNSNIQSNNSFNNKNAAMIALSKAAGLYYNGTMNNKLNCFNLSNEFIECADQTGCGLGNNAIAEDYQMCTQMVYEMNTNNITDMFPLRIWELNNLTKYCNNKYNVTPEPEWMQLWFPYDLSKPGVTSNIIFSNGLLDPFHGGGYLTKQGPTIPAIIMPHAAHHLDLRSSNIDDPIDVIQARKNETMLISTWLAQIEIEKSKNMR